ncbi:MAG: hypothetical protein IKT73_02725 [Anaerotignum sp.]|nr:hypothetical protein [Anaerotignum sp.]
MNKKWMTLLLAAMCLTGCGGAEDVPEQEVQEEVPVVLYSEQIEAYRTALTEQWDQESYLEQDMSGLAAYYYEGDALKKVGYALMDLDTDGSDELVIGVNDEADPVIFELWTMDENGEAVKLLTSHERNRYYLEWHEEGVYMLENQGSNGAANFAHHYYTLTDGNLQVQQAIVFDALANETNPWFMAYDADWDTSNDTGVEEEMALDIIASYSEKTIVPEYTPFAE